jgi:hypothetical protein
MMTATRRSATGWRIALTARGLAGRRRFRDVRAYCMFIGYPRSGHSLVGSLLDAHPRAVVAHELDALGLVARGWGRSGLFEAIVAHDGRFTSAGRQWHGYDYRVPGQWQGRFEVIEVIGDKKGGGSTLHLMRDPGLLDELRRIVGVPLRLVHHVRNPYDNIATMARAAQEPLSAAVSRYLGLCSTVRAVLDRCDATEVVSMRHETLVAQPRDELRRVGELLGLSTTPDYLDDCASIVFPDARQTRDDAEWTPELGERVGLAIAEYPFLSGYER